LAKPRNPTANDSALNFVQFFSGPLCSNDDDDDDDGIGDGDGDGDDSGCNNIGNSSSNSNLCYLGLK